MLGFTLKKLLMLVVSLAVSSVVIFAVIDLLPGDPASYMLGINASPETLAALKAELGLNEAAHRRYLDWVTGMATGDFGISYAYRAPI
ncbi:MAG: ABC transporter permease, partial [Alphaproteobacteria bacterium]|nr:ABC transporter permease [Alphaproteobacteria bacterium]